MTDKPITTEEMKEWVHNIGKDANFAEGYDDSDWAMIKAIRARLTDYDALKAEWFNKGRESVLRHNKSGCCCLFDEDDSLVSLCDAHREREDALRAEVERLKEELRDIKKISLYNLNRAEKAEAELAAARPLLEAIDVARIYWGNIYTPITFSPDSADVVLSQAIEYASKKRAAKEGKG